MDKNILIKTMFLFLLTGCSIESIDSNSSSFSNNETSIIDSNSINDEKLYSVIGKIIDTDLNYISNVEIHLVNDYFSFETLSNSNGEYCFTNIKEGTYNIHISLKDNYKLVSSKNDLVVIVKGDNESIVVPDLVVEKDNNNWGGLN